LHALWDPESFTTVLNRERATKIFIKSERCRRELRKERRLRLIDNFELRTATEEVTGHNP
jgi:hypothetical protein